MIETLSWRDRAARPALFRSMLVDRKRIFVDWLGWKVPHTDGLETDSYDGDDALYIVMPDPVTGRHRASVRLLPTERGHILADLFPHLCEDVVPRGPGIMEITRLCVSPDCPADERKHARRVIATALVRHALATRLEGYTAVTELGFLSRVAAAGWRCRPLGMPILHEGSSIGALMIEIDHRSAVELRASGVLVESVRSAPRGIAA